MTDARPQLGEKNHVIPKSATQNRGVGLKQAGVKPFNLRALTGTVDSGEADQNWPVARVYGSIHVRLSKDH
jgi:hypothetical protein